MTTGRLEQLLRERMGLVVDTIGRRAFQHALEVRQAARNLSSRDDYAQLVAADRQEWDELLELLVVPETWFFRGRASFEHMVSVARRDFLHATPARPLRVLSVPCSTGEEPYSIVMALAEDGWPLERLKVHAVDLSRRALAHAEAAEYSPRSFREITPLAMTCHERYFRRDGAIYRLDARIRSAVKFWHGNLAIREWATDGSPYDMVFCRNLLIYLHDDARRTAVDNLFRCLRPGGLVFAGHAEPLNRIDGRLEAAPPTDAFAFRRASVVTSPRPEEKLHSPETAPGRQRPPHLPPTRPRPPRTPVSPRAKQEGKSQSRTATPTLPATDALARAKQAANRGDMESASRLCREFLETSPSSAAGNCLLGVILQAQGRTREARVQFERATYLDPENVEALTHLMLDARRSGDDAGEANYRRRLERLGQRSTGQSPNSPSSSSDGHSRDGHSRDSQSPDSLLRDKGAGR